MNSDPQSKETIRAILDCAREMEDRAVGRWLLGNPVLRERFCRACGLDPKDAPGLKEYLRNVFAEHAAGPNGARLAEAFASGCIGNGYLFCAMISCWRDHFADHDPDEKKRRALFEGLKRTVRERFGLFVTVGDAIVAAPGDYVFHRSALVYFRSVIKASRQRSPTARSTAAIETSPDERALDDAFSRIRSRLPAISDSQAEPEVRPSDLFKVIRWLFKPRSGQTQSSDRLRLGPKEREAAIRTILNATGGPVPWGWLSGRLVDHYQPVAGMVACQGQDGAVDHALSGAGADEELVERVHRRFMHLVHFADGFSDGTDCDPEDDGQKAPEPVEKSRDGRWSVGDLLTAFQIWEGRALSKRHGRYGLKDYAEWRGVSYPTAHRTQTKGLFELVAKLFRRWAVSPGTFVALVEWYRDERFADRRPEFVSDRLFENEKDENR